MKKFCESTQERKHAMKIINFIKKKLKLLTNEHQESCAKCKMQESTIFVKKT